VYGVVKLHVAGRLCSRAASYTPTNSLLVCSTMIARIVLIASIRLSGDIDVIFTAKWKNLYLTSTQSCQWSAGRAMPRRFIL